MGSWTLSRIQRAAYVLPLSCWFYHCHCSPASDDLSRELKAKTSRFGLALVGARGSRIELIPFGLEPVRREGPYDNDPVFIAADGRRVAWITEAGLSLEAVSGAKIARLDGDFSNVWSLALAPDGDQVVFETTNRNAHPPNSGIQYGRFSSQLIELIVPNTAWSQRHEYSGGLGWSPDSRHIVYEREGTISKMEVKTKLSVSLAKGIRPAWSPDGQWIAFVGADGSPRMIKPDGTSDHVIRGNMNVVWALHWSPDSQYLMIGEYYKPSWLESWKRPVGSSIRLTIFRFRDGASLPVFWFGIKGGSDQYFFWIYDYTRFCRSPGYS